MPRLDSTRHERFALALAEGKTAIGAYVAAGYKPNRSAASRLSADVNILARVNQLRGDLIQQDKLDRAWIISRLMRNAEKENGAVSNRALELLGKTMGMFKDDS
jgi:phage terminase small subunit